MSAYVVGRKRLVALVAAVCLLVGLQPLSGWSQGAPGGGCGPSMQGADRLRADLGLDNALANRANSMASSALKSGQQPAPKDVQSLTDDSLDGLNDAGDQLDQATSEISKQLDGMNMPRQQRLWTKGVSDMKTARTTLKSALRQDPIARGQKIGSLSPTGVGPTTVYEAAANYQSSVESLATIGGDQGGWMDVAKGEGQVMQGTPDMPPPPNPGPDPWQEWLKRMRAQAARVQNNIKGLNAAQALRSGQFQQAQQQAGEMQKALQNAQSLANQLSQMAAACNQAANQRPQQSNQSTQPKSGQGAGTAAKAASTGGGGGGALIAGVLVAGAAAGGYALYKSMECSEPDMTDGTACGNGSCSACVALIAKLVPYCDCLEQKHPNDASGLSSSCRSSLSQMQAIKAQYRCDPGDSELLYTPIPETAIIK